MQVIRDDGSLDPELDPGLAIDQVVALYKSMVRTRVVDDRMLKLQRQGRIAFHVGSLGEEAAIVGVAAALRDRRLDRSLLPGSRCAALARLPASEVRRPHVWERGRSGAWSTDARPQFSARSIATWR